MKYDDETDWGGTEEEEVEEAEFLEMRKVYTLSIQPLQICLFFKKFFFVIVKSCRI